MFTKNQERKKERTLNQETLENFFGVIKGLCGQNFKSSCNQFAAAHKTTLVKNPTALAGATNCEHDDTHLLVSFLNPTEKMESSSTSLNVEVETVSLPIYENPNI